MLSFHAALTAAGALLTGITASAQQGFFDFSVRQRLVQFSFQSNAFDYYVLQDSPNLRAFAPVMIAFGSNGPVYETFATNPPTSASRTAMRSTLFCKRKIFRFREWFHSV
jgi:hypothetical protein